MVITVRNSVMRFEKFSVRKMYQRVFEVLLHSVEIQEIFLTLRFYVKSILAILKALILNLDFFKMSAFKKYTNSAKFRASVILNTYLIKMPGLL